MWLVLALLLGAAWRAEGQASRQPVIRVADSTFVQIVTVRDGSSLVGRITAITSDSVRLTTRIATLTIARSEISSVREVKASTMRDGEYWPPNPNNTRLLFAPTGRMLKQGEGYFSDYYLFFVGAAGGITDRISMGGGISVFPFANFSDNAFYLTPKIGVVTGEKLNVAVGALVGFAGLTDDIGRFGIGYGVATYGSPDASVTFGVGYGYNGGDWSNKPVVLLGGEKRLTKRLAFVTENYVLPSTNEPLVSYGLRLFGEKLSVDLAFANLLGKSAIFPGVPYIDLVVAF